jgi:glucosamine kinase
VAHHAAFNGGPGVVVVSGTGSVAYGRNREGETARSGGLAPATFDPGSGEWIGRTVIELLRVASDHGHSPALLHTVLKACKLADFQELARGLRDSSLDFAALFPTLAVSNDPIARRVLARAGRELAQLGADVISRLWPNPVPVEVAMYGGVLENSAEVRDSFSADLLDRYPEVRIVPGRRRPAEGALLLARGAALAQASSGAA